MYQTATQTSGVISEPISTYVRPTECTRPTPLPIFPKCTHSPTLPTGGTYSDRSRDGKNQSRSR